MLFQKQPFLHNPHYRAIFDIVPSKNLREPWRYAVNGIITWINNKYSQKHSFKGDWLYFAGEDCDIDHTVSVRTISFLGQGYGQIPQYWALSLQESCREFPNLRNWFTDVTLSLIDNKKLRFSILNNYLIRPGYIGEDIPPPTPTTPFIIQHFLLSKKIECFIGDHQLRLNPKPIHPGQVPTLIDILLSKKRIYPVVYISPNRNTSQYMLHPDRVAKLLAGNAAVYYGSDDDVNTEMTWLIPEKYRCTEGMVRVYMPNVDFDSPTDFKKHRFFSRKAIEDIGSKVVENNLVRGLARESRSILPTKILAYKDVIHLIRQKHIEELRAQAEPRELISELEMLSQEKESLINENHQLFTELEKELTRSENFNIEVLTLASKRKRLAAQLKASAASKDFGCKDCLSYIRNIPENLLETITIIENIYNNRIRFTDKAKKKAKKKTNVDIRIAWNCLSEMATTLYDLYFSEDFDNVDIEKQFTDSTQFSLALNEGKSTRNDPQLMKLRRDVYQGKTITIEPHVKYGTKRHKLLRVYYYPDQERGLLIVGHCGKHLSNYSSRKQS